MKRKNKAAGFDASAYFRAFYRHNHLRWAGTMFLTLMGVPVSLICAWLIGVVLDSIDTGTLWALRSLILWCIALAFGEAVIELLRNRFLASFVKNALTQYKSLAFSRLSEKSISAFSKENTGRYLSVLTNDINSVEENYLVNSFDLCQQALLFVAALVMMLVYSPAMTLGVILFSALPLAAAILTGGRLAPKEKAVSDSNEHLVSRLKDLLGGFSVIKSFKAEREAGKLFDSANAEAEAAKGRRRWCAGVISAVSGTCGTIMQFGIFILGAYLAITGHITAGTVMVFVQMCNYVINPIAKIPQYWAARKAARALVQKLAEVTEENAGRSGEVVKPVLNKAITLQNVQFGYEPEKPVLKDVSLTFEAGKKYALVGASGSGKSTLLNLLMGAYDSYKGSITIDGKELREIDPNSLYDLMSLIGQNVFLFDDSLRSNITMFRDFPAQKVDAAASRSGLSELIDEKGLDYDCGENGGNLSGGERQRVSIARCLLRGTPVLLLDEATASLDNQTSFAVTDAILHLDGLTRVVVTHRLEAGLLEQYDEIIVLRDGKIQERGRFDNLMAQKAYFYSLYTVTAAA